MPPSAFLALSDLDEFWTHGDLVFIGDWCATHSNRFKWKGRLKDTIASPLLDFENRLKADAYIREVKDALVTHLGQVLNRVHGLTYSPRQWAIILSVWALHYVTVMYDRYLLLQTAKRRYPNFTTIGLNESDFITPIDTREFIELAQTSGYNIQVYTRLLSLMEQTFPTRSYSVRPTPSEQSKPLPRSTISDRIKNFILDAIPGRKIVLHGSYFPTSALKTMLIASRGKIRPTYNAAYECTLVQTNTDMRDNLKIKLGHSDEFTNIISQLLPLDIPQIYIESFQNLQQHALSYGSAPRAIFTANSLWWNDPFKLWSAKCLDTGTLLLGAQHGGNYGAVRCLPAEVQEVALCDRYYSWGWTNSLDNKTNTPIIPMPANKLMNNPQWTPKKGSKKKGLLLGTTFPHRHIIRLSNTVCYNTQARMKHFAHFINSVSAHTRCNMALRLYLSDRGWEMKERWAALCPNLSLEGTDIPFLDRLAESELYICDHISTTYLESIASNHPTLLIWHAEQEPLRPSAQPYFDALLKQGILHHNAEDAAKYLDGIVSDIPTWWQAPERQKVISDFRTHFALGSPNEIQEWVNEFLSLI